MSESSPLGGRADLAASVAYRYHQTTNHLTDTTLLDEHYARSMDETLRPRLHKLYPTLTPVSLPAADAHRGYTHGAIATKLRDSTPISSSSDPAVMAIMIEQLDLNSGANVLEKRTTGLR